MTGHEYHFRFCKYQVEVTHVHLKKAFRSKPDWGCFSFIPAIEIPSLLFSFVPHDVDIIELC